MNDEIELRHLRYFLAVAETLHFSKAAQRLGIAQPPLSQQIKRLEQPIGHRLFDRTTRGVKLTLAGQLLAERTRSTMEKVHDDLAQVRRLGRGEEGTLTVGFSGSVMFTDLPIAIESYRRRYPKVELRLRELATSAQIASLLAGTLDLAFLRDGDPTDIGIKISRISGDQGVPLTAGIVSVRQLDY
jgi:DNA-binding transcriptional LysR family regulator